MKIINHSNIDQWMFDYFENNLSLHEQEVFLKYLQINPELKDDYISWQNSYLKEESIDFNYEHLLQPEKNVSVIFYFLYFFFFSFGVYLLFSQQILENYYPRKLSAISFYSTPEENSQLSEKSLKTTSKVEWKTNSQSIKVLLSDINAKETKPIYTEKTGDSKFTQSDTESRKFEIIKHINPKNIEDSIEHEIIKSELPVLSYKTQKSSRSFSLSSIFNNTNFLILTNVDNRLYINNKSSIEQNISNTGNTSAPRIDMNLSNDLTNRMSFDKYCISFDKNIRKINSGFGIKFQRMDASLLSYSSHSLDLIFAKRVSLISKKLKFIPSVSVGLTSTEIHSKDNISKKFFDIHDTIDFIHNQRVNISTGFIFQHDKFIIGAQYNDIIKNKLSNQTRPILSLLIGTDFINIHEKSFYLSPQLVYEIFKNENKVTFGTSFRYKKLISSISFYNSSQNEGCMITTGGNLKNIRLQYGIEVSQRNISESKDIHFYHHLGMNILFNKKNYNLISK